MPVLGVSCSRYTTKTAGCASVSSSISVVRKSGTTPTMVSHGAPSESSSLIRRPRGSRRPRSDAPSSRFPSASVRAASLGREHAADEAHVDERHGRAPLLVARGEPASADQRHVQRLEEASRHAGMEHPLLLPGLHWCAVDDDRAALAPAVERYEVRRRRGADAGHALHAREDVLEAPGLGARLRIRRRRGGRPASS